MMSEYELVSNHVVRRNHLHSGGGVFVDCRDFTVLMGCDFVDIGCVH